MGNITKNTIELLTDLLKQKLNSKVKIIKNNCTNKSESDTVIYTTTKEKPND
jgi:hypothetical protein